ncbi:MAG: diguanylate cyclase, partial [Ruminococcus sp.]|nr:diguanylate cyclase [Ruminococcus sp.]
KHSPVYRIGGDEFVAILQGSDYENRMELVEKLRTAYTEAYEAAERRPWQRYSASVGIADLSADDNSAELVFKHADRTMY